MNSAKQIPYESWYFTLRDAVAKLRANPRFLEGADHWDDVGPTQFAYLKKEGLLPSHHLLDVACGSFRSGRFFIEYLDPGHYCGIDQSEYAIRMGIRHVLRPMHLTIKHPRLYRAALSTESLRPVQLFGGTRFDFIWAHALYDHIDHDTIQQSLRDFADVLVPGGRLFATIFLNSHGEDFQEPIRWARNGDVEKGVTTYPDKEYWHHTVGFFQKATAAVPSLDFLGCFEDYRHPLGLSMLKFRRRS